MKFHHDSLSSSHIFRSYKVRNNSIFVQNYQIMFPTLAQTHNNQVNYG